MFYLSLLEHYNEFDLISSLILKLEQFKGPVAELEDAHFLQQELARIRRRVVQDLPVFEAQSVDYLRYHLFKVNYLIIHLAERIRALSAAIFLTEQEKYQVKHFIRLKNELCQLAGYYEEMRILHTR